MTPEPSENQKWRRPTPALRRRIVRALVKDLAIGIALLVAGEAALRKLSSETGKLVFTATVTGGHPKALNSRGLRDREFPTERPPGEVRLLCLGNSTTMGSGVALDQTYPKQLEALLNEQTVEHPYFVINAGGEGGSVDKALAFLEREGMDMDPAVVVLGFSPFDLGVAQRVQTSSAEPTKHGSLRWTQRIRRALREQAMKLHSVLHASYLYVFIDANLRRRLYRLGILQDRLDKPGGAIFAYAFDAPAVNLEEVEAAYKVYASYLERTRALLARRGIPLVLLGIPTKFRIGDGPLDNERGFDVDKIRIDPMERVAILCRKADIPFVDLRNRLRAERIAMLEGTRRWNELYNPFDYLHLNEHGLHLAAQELFNLIADEGLLYASSQ